MPSGAVHPNRRQRLRRPLDPVSAAHHFVLHRARDDPKVVVGCKETLPAPASQMQANASHDTRFSCALIHVV